LRPVTFLGKRVPVVPEPSASGYFNFTGAIWQQEQGGYFNRGSGAVALYVEEPPTAPPLGGYFNRE